MKKMRKRLGCLLLSLSLAAVAVLSGCGSGETNAPKEPAEAPAESQAPQKEPQASQAPADTNAGASEDLPEKKFVIAYPEAESGAARYEIMATNSRLLGDMFGVEFVFEDADYSPEAQIAFFENQIAAGADGIFFWPPSDSIIPTVAKLCDDAGVYWGISYRTIQDPEVAEYVAKSPYYVGKTYEDEEQTGYQIGKECADRGMKKLAIITSPRGDATGDLREKGLRKACDEFGMEIVAESRECNQPSDLTSATESFLSSYKDLDCVVEVISVVSDALSPIAKAITDAGKQETVKIAAVDFWDGMTDLFDSGILISCVGHPHIGYDPYITNIKLVNALNGTPIADEPFDITVNMFPINDVETSREYEAKYNKGDALYYSADFIKENFNKANNSDLTPETLQKFVDEFDPLKDY